MDITRIEYLALKKIVERYEQEQIMWRCKKTLRMKSDDRTVFIRGRSYKEITKTPLTLIDEQGMSHSLTGEWEKCFKINKK